LTTYQLWLIATLAGFILGSLGISLWLASSFLSVLRRKRSRLLLGAGVLAGLLASGLLPGSRLFSRLGNSPGAPITGGEVLLLAYLHLGLFTGLAIILIGRRRAPRSDPPTWESDLGLGPRLLTIHGARRPASLFPRIRWNQVYGILRRDWEVPISLDGRELPPELDGFTILHLSDLHLGSYLVAEYFEAVLEQAVALPHDVLVLTGDFLDKRSRPSEAAPWLGRLAAGRRALAVLGNHDLYDHPVEEVRGMLRSAGIELLGEEPAVFRRGAAAVAFVGLDYQNWWRPFPVDALRRKVPPEALPILLAHTPCVFPGAQAAGFPLVLCGHTHGGQVRLPGLGALFIPARYGRRYQMGLYRSGGSFLHVHPGIGGYPPLRIACPPEITRLILRQVDS
jgi:predicted MPP superfamily phosphohydrolase